MVNVQLIQVGLFQAFFARLASLVYKMALGIGAENGQGLSEYVLLVSLLVGLVVSAMGLYTSPLASFYNTLINSFDLIFSGATL